MAEPGRPLVGIAAPETSELAESVLESGGEPLEIPFPGAPLEWGVALCREWTADALEVNLRTLSPEALLFDAPSPAGLAAALAAAVRTGLPAVCAASPQRNTFAAALAGLGALPLREDPAACAVRLAGEGRPRAGDLIEDFALANALRAGAAVGCGPEAFVHLAALAREAEVGGFDRMVRAIVPGAPGIARPDSPWLKEHGLPGLLARLGDDLHDTLTVCGRIREFLPPDPPSPPQDPPQGRFAFVEARASGAEALCSLPGEAGEPAGECSVYLSEKSAARAVRWERVEPGSIVVVVGCGPRGAPGLRRLDALEEAMQEAGFRVPVLTDGLAPEGAGGVWISAFTPESAAEGVIGRLRQGDFLRIDLERRAIRTSADPEAFARRDYFGTSRARGHGYASRYARSALPALDGASFG
ncbi:hypothetical protein RxyAA322_01140 [Rubrobacter xylanophilus]|uniref:Dihydroxy-acid/6-phosphogluconate dehydratase C-terminal domain-containing protein n=1 Tax=Rubrobacter xylanophilus TaxID=49319 RepID=A0A510HE91_9ACTN|nr:dihydroxy-acid dehydratase [Rubrobacter xylanophilus]BBL78260.1 hypothetical protein RxyAA322_01140 [Rubrobacter xylanophilus]